MGSTRNYIKCLDQSLKLGLNYNKRLSMEAQLSNSTHLLAVVIPVFCMGGQVLSGQSITAQLDAPLYDRWVYPFNSVPGERAIASTFTAYNSEYDFFDDRDGQILLGFETQQVIPPGMGAGAYQVNSGRLTLVIESDDIVYDSTPDPWQTFLVDGPADEDPGRATIVSGGAFRGGFDGWSFGETGEFGAVEISGRNVYPIDFDAQGMPLDISNNITEGFDPRPFGIGRTTEVLEGELMPSLTTLTFELDVNDPDIQCYLRGALEEGLLSLVVTSLHPASEQGSGGEPYADWVMKENSLVFFGYAEAAGLELDVDIADPSGSTGDINGDGSVDVTDLLLVLNDWGCTCCLTDINADGRTDVADLLAVIGNWGT